MYLAKRGCTGSNVTARFIVLAVALETQLVWSQRGNPDELSPGCRAAINSKGASAARGMQEFVHGLDLSKTCSKAMHGATTIRWHVREDGSVERVEVVQSSRCASWDKEVVEKAKARKFPEAKVCGAFVAELAVRPDVFTK
jgi:hypothetical protein